MDDRPNVRTKTIKCLEENRGAKITSNSQEDTQKTVELSGL